MEVNIDDRELKSVYNSIVSDLADKNALIADLERKYLGSKGVLTQLLKSIGKQPQDKRSSYGKQVNLLKQYFTQKVEELQSDLQDNESECKIDLTAPFDINTDPAKRPDVISRTGRVHPLQQELEYILRIFESMGFDVLESRQLDDDYHMFTSLNFPEGHPARDNWDTFWTEENLIPPAHTSTMQNRILKSYKLPIRVVVPGRVFRNEATDARHEHTLHQVEGVYVDKDISFSNMLATIKTYLDAYFQMDLHIKPTIGYFPFTEPSAEFHVGCPFCKETGCNICGHRGWLEIMGCGMIHPNVLKEAGIDSQKYSGFAWGFGLDRLVMIKNSIEDVRKLQSGDLDFLMQF